MEDTPKSTNIADETAEVTPRSNALLGRSAISAAQRFHWSRGLRDEARDEAKSNPFLKFCLGDREKHTEERANEYLSLLDNYPDVEKEIRRPLGELPPYFKEQQNDIFSKFIAYDKSGSNFIRSAINPAATENPPESIFLAALTFKDIPAKTSYNFCDRLNEKDEQGNYIVPDRTVGNFVAWYHAQVAAYEAKNREENQVRQAIYYEKATLAIERGTLPESFRKNLGLLDPESGSYISPEYKYIDMTNAVLSRDFLLGGYYEGYPFSAKKPGEKIGLNLAYSLSNDDKTMGVICHELTHMISGESIEFDGNKEAKRIFNEGLTESIAARIRQTEYEPIEGEPELKDFDGDTYENERAVLAFLQNGGEKEIDVMDFYDAYAEQDAFREELRMAVAIEDPAASLDAQQKYGTEAELFFSGEKLPARRYGPAQQKLIDELLEAFPECKDLAGLGEMIVKKLEEFKNYKED